MRTIGRRVYLKGEHGFFDDLVGICVVMVSFVSAMQTYQGGRGVDGSDYLFTLGKSRAGIDLIFVPSLLFDAIARGDRPVRLEFEERRDIGGWPGGGIDPRLYLTPVVHAGFVRYYESVLDTITRAHGPRSEWQVWPELLRFAKVVRDAFAHNGRVRVDDSGAPASTWQGLTYGRAQNGRQVLYADLLPADVIVLMEEVDRALRGATPPSAGPTSE